MLNKLKLFKLLQLIDMGMSYSEISGSLNVGNDTIRRYKKSWMSLKNHYTIDQLKDLSREELRDLLLDTPSRDYTKALPDWNIVYERVFRKNNHSNCYVEWRKYKGIHPDGYQYTQFNLYFRRWLRENKGITSIEAHFERLPGDFCYVDWCGDVAVCVLNENGKLVPAHFFVVTLGQSSKLFVKAYPNEKEEMVIDGMNSALEFYGGLPNNIMVDNMKSAVLSNDGYDAVLNSRFEDIEKFYDTPVIPAKPRIPQEKASVEAGVGYLEENLISEVSDKIFHSFAELNEYLMERVMFLNNDTRGNRRALSRNQIFDLVDKPVLRPLPEGKLEIYTYSTRKVLNNSHVQYENHYYSVPCQWIGKRVVVKVGIDDIIITSEDNAEICRHKLFVSSGNFTEDKYTTIPDHMPEKIQVMQAKKAMTADDYVRWASRIGENMKKYILVILARPSYEQKAYNSCSGILHTCDYHPNEIGETAARNCLEKKIYTVKGFKQEFREVKTKFTLADNPSGNIRGGGYYS